MTTLYAPASGEAPLTELKQWLAITTATEDAFLLRLMDAAWDICLRFTGVEAADWGDLAPGLRQGAIRYAAHQYRERDAGISDSPPTAVVALWRPYRRMRL